LQKKSSRRDGNAKITAGICCGVLAFDGRRIPPTATESFEQSDRVGKSAGVPERG
jgi:hypothetical protein